MEFDLEWGSDEKCCSDSESKDFDQRLLERRRVGRLRLKIFLFFFFSVKVSRSQFKYEFY